MYSKIGLTDESLFCTFFKERLKKRTLYFIKLFGSLFNINPNDNRIKVNLNVSMLMFHLSYSCVEHILVWNTSKGYSNIHKTDVN